MANYIIIGGDGKEYGPVTEADIRLWITEGRLNALSQVRLESDSAWRSLGAFPEFADALPAPGPANASFNSGTGAAAPATVLNEGDYDLDIGGCVARGWKIFNSHLGILIGAFLLMLVIQLAVGATIGGMITVFFNHPAVQSVQEQLISSLLQSLLAPLVQGSMTGGIYFLILRVIRGEAATIGDLFAGFQMAFTRLYFASVIMTLAGFVCFFPFTWKVMASINPLLEKIQTTPDQAQELLQQVITIAIHGLPLLLVCTIPLVIIMVSFAFVLPLIIDRGLSVGAAFKTSWKMTAKHWFYVFGLVVVTDILSIAGALFCCVGVVFTVPLAFTVMMVAYETIFSREKT